MKKAVIYARVSTDNQEGNASLAMQLASCREFAAKSGWSVIDEISEVAPGADLARAGLEQALALIASGAADVLIVHGFDRLSRQQTDHTVLMRRVKQHGGEVVSVTEPSGYGGEVFKQLGEIQDAQRQYALDLLLRAQKGGLTMDDLIEELGG